MNITTHDDYFFCPFCGTRNPKHSIFCTKCGKKISDLNPWNVVVPSGNIQSYSTDSSGTAVFSTISDVFDEKPDNEDSTVDLKDFISAGINRNNLKEYEELGFIVRNNDGKYILTKRGKEVYKKNRKFEKEWDEYLEEG